MPHSRGRRSKTRHKLATKRSRTLTAALAHLVPGDRVAIIIDPSVHKGQPHPRFHGLTGIIAGKQGDAYLVQVSAGGKRKLLVARSEHLAQVE